MVNALAGLADGARLSQGFQDTYDNSRLNMLAGKAYTAPQEQRQSLLGQMAAVNPQAAQAQQQQWQGDEDRQTKLLVNGARYMKGALDSKNPNAVSGAWNSLRPAIIRAGLATEQELSPTWDPSYETTMHQLLGMGGAETAAYNQNKVIGDSLVGPDGRVIYQSERQPEYMWSDRAGAWIPNPNNALIGGSQSNLQGTSANPLEQGGSQAEVDANASLANQLIAAGIPEAQVDAFLAARMNPSGGPAASAAPGTLDPVRVAGVGPRPDVSPTEARRLQIAEEANQRASDAADRASRGTAPSGYRFNADGSLEPIPGAPTPASATPNQDEKNASGFYQRMAHANQEMDRITSAGYDPANVRDFYTAGEGVLNYAASKEGQQYRQAQENWVRANLRKESGAAIGASEMEQERKNYFPVPGDSPEVIEQKRRNRQVTQQAMLQSAGRAATNQGQQGPVQDRPQASTNPQRARNPQTGQVIELRNGQWVPVQ